MVVCPPGPGSEQRATRDTRDGDGLHVGRRRAEGVAGVGGEQERDQPPEREKAGAVARRRGARVDRDSYREHRKFHRKRRRHRVPQAEADHRFTARPERQVGPVGERIQQPVAEDEQAKDEGLTLAALQRKNAEKKTPNQCGHETVRPGVMHEIQRRERGVAGVDPDLFDAEEQEHRPHHVHPERGGEQEGEGSARRKRFRCERYGGVADEHG